MPALTDRRERQGKLVIGNWELGIGNWEDLGVNGVRWTKDGRR